MASHAIEKMQKLVTISFHCHALVDFLRFFSESMKKRS